MRLTSIRKYHDCKLGDQVYFNILTSFIFVGKTLHCIYSDVKLAAKNYRQNQRNLMGKNSVKKGTPGGVVFELDVLYASPTPRYTPVLWYNHQNF